MSVQKRYKSAKNRQTKVTLVFDEEKRREFLTGFRKRKLQRKKQAQEKLEKELKEERKRLKQEAKESYKKLIVSHRPIPELEHLLNEANEDRYEDDEVTVRITELSAEAIAKENNWIGPNNLKQESDDDLDDDARKQEEDEEDEQDVVPGMELNNKKKPKTSDKAEFTKKELKRKLKKEATKKVQKSAVFQMKNKIEKQKQRKKSLQKKKELERRNKKKNVKHQR